MHEDSENGKCIAPNANVASCKSTYTKRPQNTKEMEYDGYAITQASKSHIIAKARRKSRKNDKK
jgi:hypothetical protein